MENLSRGWNIELPQDQYSTSGWPNTSQIHGSRGWGPNGEGLKRHVESLNFICSDGEQFLKQRSKLYLFLGSKQSRECKLVALWKNRASGRVSLAPEFNIIKVTQISNVYLWKKKKRRSVSTRSCFSSSFTSQFCWFHLWPHLSRHCCWGH